VRDGAERDAVTQLPYLDAVCNETLRLHPIVTDVVRTARAPLTVGGYTLPADTAVAVSSTNIHEQPELCERASEFEPERFMQRKYSPFDFFPFGGSHRRCLGAAFAQHEMMRVLAEMLSSHRFELVSVTRLLRVAA
jgi:cytochrome P450